MSLPSSQVSVVYASHRDNAPGTSRRSATEALFDATENASEQSFPEQLQHALANGADLNATNADGKSLIECAVHRGTVRIARTLLEAGALLPEVGADGIDLLMQAALANCPAMVMLLVDVGGMSIEYSDATGQTALHYAVRGGSLQAVMALIERQADCNAKTTALTPALRDTVFNNDQFPAGGVTPLAMAIGSGRQDIAQALLDHGASLCKGSMNPVAVAVACNHPAMLALLLEHAKNTGEIANVLTQSALEIAAVVSPRTTLLEPLLRCRHQFQLHHLKLQPLEALAHRFGHIEHLALLRTYGARAVPVRRAGSANPPGSAALAPNGQAHGVTPFTGTLGTPYRAAPAASTQTPQTATEEQPPSVMEARRKRKLADDAETGPAKKPAPGQ